MNATDYVRWTQTTAIYLDKIHTDEERTQYEFLGAFDEIGEIAGMLKRHIRDSTKFDRRAFALELGDLAWYLARIHYDHAQLDLPEGANLTALIKELELVDEVKGMTCFEIGILISDTLRPHYVNKAAAARYIFGPKPSSLDGIIEAAIQGFSRDDVRGNFVTSMYRRISEQVSTVGILMHLSENLFEVEAIFDWYAICLKYSYDVIEVLQDNVNKLESRKERNTLHGKGSER
jgi:hypothetical protein